MGRKVRAQVDKYPGKALTMLLIRNNLLTKSPGPLSNQELIAALEVALVIARSPKAPKPQRECGRRLKSANADAGAAVLFHTARYTVPWPREVQKQECQTSKPYAPKPSVLTPCPKPHLLKPKPQTPILSPTPPNPKLKPKHDSRGYDGALPTLEFCF